MSVNNRDPVDAVVSGEAWIAIYGMGYVGRALTAAFLRRGLRVIGVDIDKSKLNDIREGRVKFFEAEVREAIVEGLKTGALK